VRDRILWLFFLLLAIVLSVILGLALLGQTKDMFG
jgi:hypothetical protein